MFNYIYSEVGFEETNFTLEFAHEKEFSDEEFGKICCDVLIEYHTSKLTSSPSFNTGIPETYALRLFVLQVPGS